MRSAAPRRSAWSACSWPILLWADAQGPRPRSRSRSRRPSPNRHRARLSCSASNTSWPELRCSQCLAAAASSLEVGAGNLRGPAAGSVPPNPPWRCWGGSKESCPSFWAWSGLSLSSEAGQRVNPPMSGSLGAPGGWLRGSEGGLGPRGGGRAIAGSRPETARGPGAGSPPPSNQQNLDQLVI